jgi:hypothetical protein
MDAGGNAWAKEGNLTAAWTEEYASAVLGVAVAG